MQKVISLFKLDYEGTRLVFNELVEGAEWVVAGEGRATEKIDGTSCLIRGGKLYKRYDAKKGKTPPANFERAQEEPDPVTGHWPGWVPVSDKDPGDKWHIEAWLNSGQLPDATYELIGPKVQGNMYGLQKHIFRLHGDVNLENVPTDFEGLKVYFEAHPQYEGIVWHHPDGRMVKIKRRDFGFKWEGAK
jgi:hypothetical protein